MTFTSIVAIWYQSVMALRLLLDYFWQLEFVLWQESCYMNVMLGLHACLSALVQFESFSLLRTIARAF